MYFEKCFFFQAAAARWDRDPAQAACRAYLSARGEMGVLLPLRHPNIAPFLAACTSPLALILALAPMVFKIFQI